MSKAWKTRVNFTLESGSVRNTDQAGIAPGIHLQIHSHLLSRLAQVLPKHLDFFCPGVRFCVPLHPLPTSYLIPICLPRICIHIDRFLRHGPCASPYSCTSQFVKPSHMKGCRGFVKLTVFLKQCPSSFTRSVIARVKLPSSNHPFCSSHSCTYAPLPQLYIPNYIHSCSYTPLPQQYSPPYPNSTIHVFLSANADISITATAPPHLHVLLEF